MPVEEIPTLPELIVAGISLTLFFSSLLLWILWFFRRFRQPVRMSAMPLRPWAVGWVNFGIFICGLISVIFLVQIILSALYGFLPLDESSEAWAMALGALTLQSSFLIAYYTCRRYFPMLFRGNLSSRQLNPGNAFLTALAFFIRSLPLIGIVAFLWNSLLNLMVDYGLLDSFEPQEAVLIFTSGQSPVALALLAFFAIIVAPLAEEVIFRGCIYRFLKSKLQPYAAMLISALVFAVIHGNLMAFVPLAFVGFLLAYSYEKERNLLVPIFFHALFNLLTLSVTVLHAISGKELPY